MAIKKILIKGTPLRDEAPALGAITPGHLVERGTGGVQVHSTAAGNAARVVALERAMTGDGIDVAYATGDEVLLAYLRPGDMFNGLVAAGASAIADGNYLESAGDGTLRVVSTSAATADTERAGIVAQAMEAVDNSGGGSAVRIKARAL